MARGGALSTRPFVTRCDRLRLDVRISQLTNGMPDERESATVRDITEQYRSIRHHLHVDPAFQLSKQLRGPSAFRSRGRDRQAPENRRGPLDGVACALEFVESPSKNVRDRVSQTHGTENPTYDGPSTHLRAPDTAPRREGGEGSSPSPVSTIGTPPQVDQPGLLAGPKMKGCERRFTSLEVQNRLKRRKICQISHERVFTHERNRKIRIKRKTNVTNDDEIINRFDKWSCDRKNLDKWTHLQNGDYILRLSYILRPFNKRKSYSLFTIFDAIVICIIILFLSFLRHFKSV